MKILFLIALAPLLTGCIGQLTELAKSGAEAADSALLAANIGQCKLPTAGALERKYHLFSNPGGEQAEAWRTLCYGEFD